jgi:hypothetical protein
MVEPFTLAAVGAVALTEGVKFLYGQAGELLKRYRERKAGKDNTPPAIPAGAQDLLEHRLDEAKVDFDAVGRLADQLPDLLEALSGYVQGYRPVDPNDERLLAAADGVRRALEAMYRQSIRFKGEPSRPGTSVESDVDVERVRGYVAGVRARIVEGGARVRVTARADEVAEGGKLVGGEFDEIRGG